MSTPKDREKVEIVGTVVVRGCRYYLEKVFKENLKGGELHEFSCGWLTGIKFTPSPLSPPKLEKADHDNDDITDRSGNYSSFAKKVLDQNTKGGVLHEFSYSWLTGSRLTPVAFFPKTDKGNNPNKPLSADGYRRLFAYVILENLKGGILHEYSYGRLTSVKLTPILPEQIPSPIHYDHEIFYIIKTGTICQHFSVGTGFFSELFDKKIVLQPYRFSPDGDHDHQHQSGRVDKDHAPEI